MTHRYKAASVPSEHLSRDDRVRALRHEGKSVRQIAKEVGCGVATVHRAISGDDLIRHRMGDAAGEALDLVNALRRAIKAAEHGDVTGLEMATDDLVGIDLDQLTEDLWELAEQNSLDGSV